MHADLVRGIAKTLDEILLPPLLAQRQLWLSEEDRMAMIQAIYSGQAAPQPVSEQVIAAVVAKTDHAERHQVAAKLLPSLAGMYDKVFDMTSPFALRPTVAYTGKPEFCVIATQTILAGTVIPGLEAVLVPFVGELTPRTKRSVVRVQKSQADVGLMGPLSRVNHECKAWTVKFVKRNGKMSGFQVVQAQAVRDMHHGDEITVNYGPDYFGDDNEDCLCRSDELDRSNGWSDGPQPDHMVDLVVHREKSRRATADARKSALETRVYSYRPWALPDGPRRPGDHVRALSGLPTSRCVTLHCRMRFVDLPFGSMCAGCEQQALAHAQSTASTLQRYYRALARSEKPLGLYHTQTPLASIAEYLKTLEIPGWRIYARPIRFNSGRHKTLDMRDAVPDSPEAIDLPVGASCDSAAADGGRQTGQIWLTVGDWRPDEANNLVEFREVTTTLYASVLLLRKRKMYLFDPCFSGCVDEGAGTGEEGAVPARLGDLRSLHRARTLINSLTKGKRRVDISNGIALGSRMPLDSEKEYDLSLFACYELLEQMRTDERSRETPDAWATETIKL